jgi:hypothetical protein
MEALPICTETIVLGLLKQFWSSGKSKLIVLSLAF